MKTKTKKTFCRRQIPFLERDDIDSLPYVVTATLLTLPVSLHEDVIDVLCWHLLPFTMNSAERPSTVDNCVLPGWTFGFSLHYLPWYKQSNGQYLILSSFTTPIISVCLKSFNFVFVNEELAVKIWFSRFGNWYSEQNEPFSLFMLWNSAKLRL